MTLKDTITEDMKTAMKAGDSAAKSTISMLRSAIKNREIEKRGKLAKEGALGRSHTGEAMGEPDEAELDAASALTDEEVTQVVSSELKKRKESITTYEEAGRAELAESEKAEAEVLAKYLPEQMDEEEVKQLIAQAVQDSGAASLKDMGKVMGLVSPKTKGRFDGSRLAELVKQVLGA
jgi:uncharacterized protein YqeY